MNDANEFQGKRVVVTGAAGVYGRWIAGAFARRGACLLLSDRRGEALAALAGQLDGAQEVVTHSTELLDPQSIQDLVRTVREQWGTPDIVINNAGIYPYQPLLGTSLDDWHRIMDVNLTAPFLITRDLARLMIDQGVPGSIVNMTSGAATTTRPGSGPYSTSKAALSMLTRTYALELAPYGIRVNAVSPGFAPGSEVSRLDEDYVEMMSRTIPLGRTSGPHDSSEAVLFLCSDRASYITGTTLTVDGGRSAGIFPGAQR
jgi:3-oxoacyl-[acyl-carrier protein] reductase